MATTDSKLGAGTDQNPDFEAKCLRALKKSGHRITAPRLQVIRTLARSRRALGAGAIFEAIQAEGGKADLVSVYRILSTMSELGLIHHIGLVDGYVACGMDGQHPEQVEHLVCEVCGEVQELTSRYQAPEAARSGFKSASVKVEVLGTCRSCQSA